MKVSKINSEFRFGNARTKVEANFDKEIPNAKRRKRIEDPAKATKSAEAKITERISLLKGFNFNSFQNSQSLNANPELAHVPLDCHSGKSGNRLAKSRNINAHGTLGPHAWLEK